MKQIFISLLLVAASPSGRFQHGTVVFTLAIRDGLVMASDGLTVYEAGDAANPSLKFTAPAEPKIVICGERFLCGMAGINPVPTNAVKIKYRFQDWIAAIDFDQTTSPRQFSKSIQAKARVTFRKFGYILKTDPYWKSEASGPYLLAFQVAGYDGPVPQICTVLIEVDRQHYRLNYPEPACEQTLQWKNPSPTSFFHYCLSLCDSLEEALKAGTPEKRRFDKIQPRESVAAAGLLPDAPLALQLMVGNAAAFVRVVDEFNPDKAGGVTTVGVIRHGKLPAVFRFPN